MRSMFAPAAALAALLLGAGSAAALTVPFTEEFAADAAGWEDADSDPLTWNAVGGPEDGPFVSQSYSWFGYENPFGGGPVLFRANVSADASGGAFVGDWVTGVEAVTAWVYQDTGVPLTFYLRVATPANFPGAVIADDVAVPSGEWTQITIAIETSAPPCFEETVPCAQAFANVGNVQLGTDAPAELTVADESFLLGLAAVSLVPEPGAGLLGGASVLGLLALARRRR